jgi:hypothetical protein
MSANRRLPEVKEKSNPIRAKSAWLVTWDGTSPPSERVVAIFNHRLGSNRVREMVEHLYIVLSRSSPAEKLRYAKLASNNPYPAELNTFERICCGHNPWLHARRVTNLIMKDGQLTWTEPPSCAQLYQELLDAGLIRHQRPDATSRP